MPRSIIISGGKVSGINIQTDVRKVKKRGRLWLAIYITAAAGVIFALLVYAGSRARPIIISMTEIHAHSIGVRIVGEAVEAEIARFTYDDLISFEKSADGKINALKINILNVNRLKSRLSVMILDKISDMGEIILYIPAGNLFSGEFLSGRGPKIRVSLVPTGYVITDIRSLFTSAGINQTRHQIMLDVRVSLSITMPFAVEALYIYTSLAIAETIIVGDVPNVYVTGE